MPLWKEKRDASNRCNSTTKGQMEMNCLKDLCTWVGSVSEQKYLLRHATVSTGRIIARAIYIAGCLAIGVFVTSLLIGTAQTGLPGSTRLFFGLHVGLFVAVCLVMFVTAKRAARGISVEVSELGAVLHDAKWPRVRIDSRAQWHAEIFDRHVVLVLEVLGESIARMKTPSEHFNPTALLEELTELSRELDPGERPIVKVAIAYLARLLDEPAGIFLAHGVGHEVFTPDLFAAMAEGRVRPWPTAASVDDRRPVRAPNCQQRV